jgi:hypothetical protein
VLTPAISLSSVDLPAPVSPTMPSESPRASWKLTSSSAVKLSALARLRRMSATRRSLPARVSSYT